MFLHVLFWVAEIKYVGPMYACIRTHTHAHKVGHVENIMTSAVDRTAGESIKQKSMLQECIYVKKTFISKFKKTLNVTKNVCKRNKKCYLFLV